MEYKTYKLKNGIQLIHKRTEHTSVAHCGFFINTGSRDENPKEHGLAHLIEHMLFKGTKKRNTNQVLNRLEVVGGELNAFTSKDKTCIYASFVKNHFLRAVDLLADITFHSDFPEKQLIKEKNIIAEEIDMYLDSPEERIYDEFQEHLFGNHPLAHNILGTKETIKNFGTEELIAFRKKHFSPNSIVFVLVGNISFKRCLKICENKIGTVKLYENNYIRIKPKPVKPFQIEQKEKFVQAHGIIGGYAYPLGHPLRPALIFLTNLLGGPSLNSKLSLNLREKKGYTYQIDCQYQSFSDAGMVSITWSTDEKNFIKSKKAIYTELKLIIEKPLSNLQLKKYKTQLIGQLIMAEENNLSMLFVLGKGILDINHVEPLHEIIDEINAITAENIQQVAKEIFDIDKLSSLSYLPSEISNSL